MKVMLPAKMLVWSFLLAVMAVSGDGKVLRDSLETKLFSASIECLPPYQTCDFTLVNNGEGEYSVLTLNSPLNEEKLPKGLVVTRDGIKLDYKGVMMKREAPSSREFKFLGPRKSLSSKVDLSRGYDTSKPGTYTVKVNDYLEYEEGRPSSLNEEDIKLAHISSPAFSFRVAKEN